MNKMAITIMILGCLSLSACAQLVWTKPGATTSDFNTDEYSCEHDSMTATPATPILGNCIYGSCQVNDFNQGNRTQLFNDCMAARGWSLEKVNNQAHASSIPPPPGTTDWVEPSTQPVATSHAERLKQRKEENKACTQKHEDGMFKTWKEVADCQNRNWARWVKDAHYRWPDLIASLNATRSQLSAKLDAGKITLEDMKAKIADKLTAIKTEELKRKAILAGSNTQKTPSGDAP